MQTALGKCLFGAVLGAGKQNWKGWAGQKGSRTVKELSNTGLAERVQADSSRCLLSSLFHPSARSGFICHLEPHRLVASDLSLSRDMLIF